LCANSDIVWCIGSMLEEETTKTDRNDGVYIISHTMSEVGQAN
jgi:hypothetical protein